MTGVKKQHFLHFNFNRQIWKTVNGYKNILMKPIVVVKQIATDQWSSVCAFGNFITFKRPSVTKINLLFYSEYFASIGRLGFHKNARCLFLYSILQLKVFLLIHFSPENVELGWGGKVLKIYQRSVIKKKVFASTSIRQPHNRW